MVGRGEFYASVSLSWHFYLPSKALCKTFLLFKRYYFFHDFLHDDKMPWQVVKNWFRTTQFIPLLSFECHTVVKRQAPVFTFNVYTILKNSFLIVHFYNNPFLLFLTFIYSFFLYFFLWSHIWRRPVWHLETTLLSIPLETVNLFFAFIIQDRVWFIIL